jgi:hypothetical protein
MKKIIFTGLGADPEVFLQHKATGKIISAEGYIKGTKDIPFSFDPDQPMFGLSLDNVLAEFTIPPAKSPDEFYAYLQKGLAYINSVIPSELCTAIIPSATLDPAQLQTEQALVFGCEPDVNAYKGWLNDTPHSEDLDLRSCGGHAHVGYLNSAPMYDVKNVSPQQIAEDTERQRIVKALDLFVGIPSTIWEPDNKRKELYGKAGTYRPKPYGLEYRTISNYYLANEQLTKTIYNQIIKALDWLNEGNNVDKELGEFVQQVINNNDQPNANHLIKEFSII